MKVKGQLWLVSQTYNDLFLAYLSSGSNTESARSHILSETRFTRGVLLFSQLKIHHRNAPIAILYVVWFLVIITVYFK